VALDPPAAEPGAADDDHRYGAYYYAHDCGVPYERNEHWLGFFDAVARGLTREVQPASVLDVGCAFGMLVEAFRKLDIEAYGVDVSDYAIAHVDPSIEDYVWLGSVIDPLPRRYELITCIEVLEHLTPADCSRAIDNITNATDQIMLCSTPMDYGEPTHLNVRPPEEWAADLAKRGFFRDLAFDGSFLTPWAALYRRAPVAAVELVRDYERANWRLRAEVEEVRRAIISLHEQLEEQQRALDTVSDNVHEELDHTRDELLVTRDELLVTRDELIGARAELGEALGRNRVLEADALRLRTAAHELDQFRRAPVWRVYSPYQRLRSRVGRKVRAALARFK
jgi:SAM-dependent methyltransferase